MDLPKGWLMEKLKRLGLDSVRRKEKRTEKQMQMEKEMGKLKGWLMERRKEKLMARSKHLD